MLSPDIKKTPLLQKIKTESKAAEDKNYIKTTTAEDGGMKKLFMAAGEALLIALVGKKVTARYLRNVTKENIQKEKVSALVCNIITPELLRHRLRIQEQQKLALKNQLKLAIKGASKETLAKEEHDKLKASEMQGFENQTGKNKSIS
ncbi:MAG: hypothetical protein LBE20_01385 [Deltaproteobacteria bacterium]|jgi:hypothetical protein|nr:hypothetical protein [Deltaproteobacteria bacterium]